MGPEGFFGYLGQSIKIPSPIFEYMGAIENISLSDLKHLGAIVNIYESQDMLVAKQTKLK